MIKEITQIFIASKIYIILGIILLLVACKKDIIVNPIDDKPLSIATAIKIVDENCIPIEAYINAIEANAQNDLLITEIEDGTSNFILHYATGEALPICKDSLFCWQFNPDWQVNFQFMDSSISNAIFWADSFQVDLQTELNPSGYAPLTAHLNLSSALNCSINIEVIGQNGPYSSVNKTFESIDTVHQLPILGLYPAYQNSVLVTAISNGFVIAIDTVFIQTNSIDVYMPQIYIDVNEVEQMQEGFQLISYLQGLPNKPFMIDQFGYIRWYLDYRDHQQLGTLSFDVGIERLQNGNYYFGSYFDSMIYEVDILGNIINSWDLQGYNYHHQVYEKPNGNFLVTCQLEGSEHIEGGFTMQDRIIELDRSSGTIVKVWDARNILNETRTNFVDFSNETTKDWAHINAVTYDETDNTIVFSSRHQSTVCKVDYNDNILWLFTPQVDLGENRQGQQLDQFALTAVDQNNQVYNEQIQMGYENIVEFEWTWYQHAVKKISDNRFMVFDNGNNRNFGTSNNYSRAVIYQINPTEMTIKQEWTFGRDLGWEGYSSCCSDVDFLPETNHIVFSPGRNVSNGNGNGAKIIEIDYNTQEIVFQARLNSNGVTLHRSERLTIYP